MALKQIKNKIRAVGKTHKVTRAMEAVSAVKMRKAQEQALGGRMYAQAALAVLSRVSASTEGRVHPFMKKRNVKGLTLLVITSDKGLAGALNTSVIKEVLSFIKKNSIEKEHVEILAVGKKGYEFFSKRGYTTTLMDASDPVIGEDVTVIANAFVHRFAEGASDLCAIVYTNFLSSFMQKPVSRIVLPLSFEALEDVVKGIAPVRGKYAERKIESRAVPTYTIEPSPEDVLEILIPKLVGVLVFHALLEGRASEHSARRVAMKNASDKARDLTKELTLVFNKARQAVITREVSEIIGGIEALRH